MDGKNKGEYENCSDDDINSNSSSNTDSET